MCVWCVCVFARACVCVCVGGGGGGGGRGLVHQNEMTDFQTNQLKGFRLAYWDCARIREV